MFLALTGIVALGLVLTALGLATDRKAAHEAGG